jgi:O-methyltransferase
VRFVLWTGRYAHGKRSTMKLSHLLPVRVRRPVWLALSRATKRWQPRPDYDADGLATYGKNVGWRNVPGFQEAYSLGARSGHKFPGISHEWRVHIACWAAAHALHIDGDLVECGVNTGCDSLAICKYLDIDSVGRTFWLFDTYRGIPLQQASTKEIGKATAYNEIYYEECFELAKKNFAPFKSARLVRGLVPETLSQFPVDRRVAYLHLDMNLAAPELAAIRFFWPKLSHGAVVLLDDYAWQGHEAQYDAMNDFAASVGVRIATLPTGQGLIIRP